MFRKDLVPTPEVLSSQIADALNEVAPQGISFRANGPLILLENELEAQINLGVMYDQPTGVSDRDVLETAVRSALATAQEFIMESTAEYWPVPNEDSDVEVEVSADMVRAFFGGPSGARDLELSFPRKQ